MLLKFEEEMLALNKNLDEIGDSNEKDKEYLKKQAAVLKNFNVVDLTNRIKKLQSFL